MFDIGFSELVVIGLVALVVLGPEKLPKAARTVGALLGRAQRYVADVKADIAREVELDELRKMRSEMENAANSMQQQFNANLSEIESHANQIQSDIQQTALPNQAAQDVNLADHMPGSEHSPAAPAGSQQRSPRHEMLR